MLHDAYQSAIRFAITRMDEDICRLSGYERALRIYERALGPDRPNVATGLENYAPLLQSVDRPEEAASLEARARAIRTKRT